MLYFKTPLYAIYILLALVLGSTSSIFAQEPKSNKPLEVAIDLGKTTISFLDGNGLNFGELNLQPKKWFEVLYIPKLHAEVIKGRSGVSVSLERYFANYQCANGTSRCPNGQIGFIKYRHFMLASILYRYTFAQNNFLDAYVNSGFLYRFNRKGQSGEGWVAGYYPSSSPNWKEAYFEGKTFDDAGFEIGLGLKIKLITEFYLRFQADYMRFSVAPKSQIGLGLSGGYTIGK